MKLRNLLTLLAVSLLASAAMAEGKVTYSEVMYQPAAGEKSILLGYNLYGSYSGITFGGGPVSVSITMNDTTIPVAFNWGLSDETALYFATELGNQSGTVTTTVLGVTSSTTNTYGGMGDLHLGVKVVRPMSGWDVRYGLDIGYSMNNAKTASSTVTGTLQDVFYPAQGLSGGLSASPYLGAILHLGDLGFGLKETYYYRMDRKTDNSTGTLTTTTSGGAVIESKLFLEYAMGSLLFDANLNNQQIAASTDTVSGTTTSYTALQNGGYGLGVTYAISNAFKAIVNYDSIWMANQRGFTNTAAVSIASLRLRYSF